MAIKAKQNSSKRVYVNAPADTYQGVCVDVVDLGIETPKNPQYKPAHKIRIVFQLDELITDKMMKAAKKLAGDASPLSDIEKKVIGTRLTINQKFTLSLHEKALLRKTLESWRGTPFTSEELDEGFDVESLVGVNANINVVHREWEGKTYANIASIAPWKKKFGAFIEPDENYVRVVDRPKDGAAPGAAAATDDDDEGEDDGGIAFKQ